MAMIDYGALLKVNGVFINKNKGLFMDTSDTEYNCKQAFNKIGNSINIDGNFFVYAGDKNFLIVFYKTYFYVIHNEKIIYEYCAYNLSIAETLYFDGLPSVKIERLDSTLYIEPFEKQTWAEYVKENYVNEDGSDLTGNEIINELDNGKNDYKRFLKFKKRIYRLRNQGCYKYRKNRFIATWKYNDKQYEVIFGYGIDNDEKIWKKISSKQPEESFAYGLTEIEKEKINQFFV